MNIKTIKELPKRVSRKTAITLASVLAIGSVSGLTYVTAQQLNAPAPVKQEQVSKPTKTVKTIVTTAKLEKETFEKEVKQALADFTAKLDGLNVKDKDSYIQKAKKKHSKDLSELISEAEKESAENNRNDDLAKFNDAVSAVDTSLNRDELNNLQATISASTYLTDSDKADFNNKLNAIATKIADKEAKEKAEAERQKAEAEKQKQAQIAEQQKRNGQPYFGADGLLVMNHTAKSQQVINLLLGIPGHSYGSDYHASTGLDSLIDQLSVEEAVDVIHKIEGAGFGQTAAGLAGTDSHATHQAFLDQQVNGRQEFNHSIFNLLKMWGTYSYSGY